MAHSLNFRMVSHLQNQNLRPTLERHLQLLAYLVISLQATASALELRQQLPGREQKTLRYDSWDGGIAQHT